MFLCILVVIRVTIGLKVTGRFKGTDFDGCFGFEG